MMLARRHRLPVVCGIAALLIICAPEKVQANIRFTQNVDLPGIGIRIRIMTNAREHPLPAPRIYTYQRKTPAGNINTDMFDPRELWLADQHAGEWLDQNDNRLTIAALRYALPTGFQSKHVLREDYEAKRPQNQSSENWTLDDATAWVKTFTGDKAIRVSAIKSASTKFRDLYQIDCSTESSYAFGYLFRMQSRSTVKTANRTQWYVALFTLDAETARAAAMTEAQRKFLPYVATTALASNTPEGPSKRFQNTRFSPDASEKTNAFLASRKQVADSIRNMQDWWYAETASYIFLSNLNTRYRVMVKQLQSDLEVLRNAHMKLIPPRKEIDAVSVIKMFATSKEYMDYVGQDYAWTAGLWLGARKELVIRPLGERSTQQDREEMKSTAYHESFHQYLFYALNQRTAAAWFNEGHAALFEQVAITRQGMELKEDAQKVNTVRTLISENRADLHRVLEASYEEFYAGDDTARHEHYSLAWALCYFLRKSADPNPASPYASLAARYVDAVMTTQDPLTATRDTFKDVDIDALQEVFNTFWSTSRDRTRAQRNRLFQ